MMNKLLKILSCPFVMLSGLALLSITALIAAFASEAFLGLEPCILCVYQRWPYAIVAILSLFGVILCKKQKKVDDGCPPVPAAVPWIMFGNALVFLANSIIASYHTGVEQKWWASAVEGCAVPDFGDEPKSILENIMSAPTGNCAEIPWQDPLIGLSMANYNALLCFGLFVICTISALKLMNKRPEET